MSTDYLDRVYWPNRSNGASRTTYGFHYGSQALLNEIVCEERRGGGALGAAAAAYSREGRLEALRLLEKRPQTAAAELPRSRLEDARAYHSWSAAYRPSAADDSDRRLARPGSYSSRKSLPPSVYAAAPRDVTLRAAPVNDPFVPNMSYKEFVKKKRLVASDAARQDAQGSSDNHQIWQRLRKAARPTVESIGVSETSTRMGRGGGSWRHIKEVLQGMGSRIVFIDGGPSLDDLHRMRSRNLGQHPDRLDDNIGQRGQSGSVHVDALEKQALESANWRVMR